MTTRSALTHAQNFLTSVLAAGPVPARDVEAQARKAGISAGTLRRASVALKVKRTKEAVYHGAWVWELPYGPPPLPPDRKEPQYRTLYLCCLLCGQYKDLPQIKPGAVTQVCSDCIAKREGDAILRIVQLQNEEQQEQERVRTIEDRGRMRAQLTDSRLLPRAVDFR